MDDPIVLITCGDCYHKYGHPELPKHTASEGVPHQYHWPMPKSEAEDAGYRDCKWCFGFEFGD